MSPEPKEETVSVVMIKGTGDGLVQPGVVATPGGQPNLAVTVIGPLLAIAIRAIHLFLTTLLGLVTAAMTPAGGEILASEAGDFLDILARCASLSVAVVGIGLIKDFITLFGRLENKFPLMSGNV